MFFTELVFAEQYKMKLIVDFSRFSEVKSDAVWLPPLVSPLEEVFFVAQDNGLIYLLDKDEPNNQHAILNLPLESNTPTFITLTAISLHPSFSLSEEPGYATFYTAHTTEFELDKSTNRLGLSDTDIDTETNFNFETVITAWTYDFDKQKINPETQREVLRIPITSKDKGIQQLTFDLYQKPWNPDYGQLYFSLKYDNELKTHSLYSGVILRIYPLMFGTREYTISQNNPFIKTPEINSEIVVMGAHDIQHFFWAKNSHESIFIQHNNNVQHWLSKAKVGDDLQSQAQPDFLWQQTNKMSPMLLYQGRNFLNLRNKMVFFTLIDDQWYLTSRPLEPLSNESPIIEEVSATQGIILGTNVSISQNNENEIIIFDHHQNKLYSLQSTNSQVIQTNDSGSVSSGFEATYIILFISILAVLIAVLFFTKRNNLVHKLALDPLDNKYARFEYLQTKESILLYKINQQKEHKPLNLKDIIRCEILLNSKVIAIIDSEAGNAISNLKETEIRALYTKEQNMKMGAEQTRQIEVILSDTDASYPVCLYLRKGNNRVTGTKYYRCVDILIDLCWVISKQLNPKVTETRIVPVVTFPHRHIPVATSQTADPASSRNNNANKSNKMLASSNLPTPKPEALKPEAQSTPKTEVVNALEKLVHLHKQGYLSDEEFSLAKTNLLQ
ncbi:hypothetical protein [Paraglaciecola arctica]|uniref:SHOCT domain-containing protein n=1 Tax=Paraglaciecola arctica BSs20135 TaxID=493475 RepID=K6Z1Q2_9ALTE|nr:hypothetical protein [Paraglaciecola arctica]GAC17380.1 hypothetical protein GARC_0398 [Paraglaciecola arctica BSs20135]